MHESISFRNIISFDSLSSLVIVMDLIADTLKILAMSIHLIFHFSIMQYSLRLTTLPMSGPTGIFADYAEPFLQPENILTSTSTVLKWKIMHLKVWWQLSV
jgi:hypothetical protein